MKEVISTILKELLPDIKKYFPVFVFLTFVLALIFAFLPDYCLEKLYLKELKERKKEWFGILVIVSFASIIVIALLYTLDILKSNFKINKIIKELDLIELNILYQYFYKTKINTIRLNENNPTVGGLECRGIILKELIGADEAYYSINTYCKKALFKRLKKEADRLENMNMIASQEE